MQDKRITRELALELRAALAEEERKLRSQKIQKKIIELPEFKQAKTIMTYLDFRGEVEMTSLAEKILASGKRLVLPCCAPQSVLIPAVIRDLAKDIEPGKWGIREPKKENIIPAEPEEIDLVIVPGVAFDRQGNRLGYGGGYYDRFLPQVHLNVKKIATAFTCQVLPEIPVDPLDVKMDALITEDGIFWFN